MVSLAEALERRRKAQEAQEAPGQSGGMTLEQARERARLRRSQAAPESQQTVPVSRSERRGGFHSQRMADHEQLTLGDVGNLVTHGMALSAGPALEGFEKATIDAIFDTHPGQGWSEVYEQENQAFRDRISGARRRAGPLGAAIAEGAGTAASLMATGGGIAAAGEGLAAGGLSQTGNLLKNAVTYGNNFMTRLAQNVAGGAAIGGTIAYNEGDDAATGAAVGAALGPVGAAIGVGLGTGLAAATNGVRRVGGKIFDKGKLSPQMVDYLRREGIDAADLTPGDVQLFLDIQKRTGDPTEAIRDFAPEFQKRLDARLSQMDMSQAAEARRGFDPAQRTNDERVFGVQLSQSQRAGDSDGIMEAESRRYGAQGPRSQAAQLEMDRQQMDQITGAQETLGRRMTNVEGGDGRAYGHMDAVRDRLVRRAEQEKAAAVKYDKKVEAAGRLSTAPESRVQAIYDEIEEEAAEAFLNPHPSVKAAIERYRSIPPLRSAQTNDSIPAGKSSRTIDEAKELNDARVIESSSERAALRAELKGKDKAQKAAADLAQAARDRGDVIEQTTFTPDELDLHVNYAQLEKVRGDIRKAARESSDPQESRQLNQLVDMFDRKFDDAVVDNIFSGGELTGEMIKKRREMWRNYYKRNDIRPDTAAGVKDAAGKLIKKIVAREADTKQFTEALFGTAQTGQGPMSKQLAVRAKEILPPEDFEMVRRAAWDHVTQGGMKRTRGETLDDEMLPTKIAERIINFARRGEGGTEFAPVLFTDAERKSMLRFANVIKKIPPPKAGNPSGSAHEWGRLMRDYMASGLGATVGSSVGSVAGPGGALVGAAVGRQAGKQAVDATTDQAALNALRAEFGIRPGASQDPSFAIRENLRWGGRITGKSIGANLPQQLDSENE